MVESSTAMRCQPDFGRQAATGALVRRGSAALPVISAIAASLLLAGQARAAPAEAPSCELKPVMLEDFATESIAVKPHRAGTLDGTHAMERRLSETLASGTPGRRVRSVSIKTV